MSAHRLSSAEDAGTALYEALTEHQVTWDEAEAAAVEECRVLGKPVEGLEVTGRGDGTPLCQSFASSRSVVMSADLLVVVGGGRFPDEVARL